MILLKIAGIILAAIVVLVLLYTLGLTLFYITQNIIKIVKEDGANDRNDKP